MVIEYDGQMDSNPQIPFSAESIVDCKKADENILGEKKSSFGDEPSKKENEGWKIALYNFKATFTKQPVSVISLHQHCHTLSIHLQS